MLVSLNLVWSNFADNDDDDVSCGVCICISYLCKHIQHYRSLDDQCLYLTTAWGSINRLLRVTLDGGITVIEQATLAAATTSMSTAAAPGRGGGGGGAATTGGGDFSNIKDASVSPCGRGLVI